MEMQPVSMEFFCKSSVRMSGFFSMSELRMLEYLFLDAKNMGFGNCFDMTPNSFKSSLPKIISLLIAVVITALELAERPDARRLICTVPKVGTGSPLTLTYLVLWAGCFFVKPNQPRLEWQRFLCLEM